MVAEWRFEAVGVPWRVDTRAPLDEEIRRLVLDRIDVFDRDWSRFREDSWVRVISQVPGRFRLPRGAAPLLALYRDLYETTGGSVSPLVGGALESLGYDRTYRLTPADEPTGVPSWDDAMHWDGDYLTTRRPTLLDVGAAGKGYLVDLVSDVLAGAGIDAHVVDASGDMVARGWDVLRIALEDPTDTTKAIGIANLRAGALCASATNRRAWADGLHHVLDGRTGEPTRDVIATWALADSALIADGLATALFFVSAAELPEGYDFRAIRMFSNGRVEYSADFDGEVFT